jgi:hypothetical protein
MPFAGRWRNVLDVKMIRRRLGGNTGGAPVNVRHALVIAVGAAAAIGLAPAALADTGDTDQTQDRYRSSFVATPGPSARNAAALQQPFGGDVNALIFHN